MNKAIFMGNIVKDIETRKTNKGDNVISFTIAVQRKFTNVNGERETDFFNLTAFGKTGEFISKYFSKGKKILVEARIQNRSWEDETGAKRYVTDYIVEQTYFADSKSDNVSNKEDTDEYITIEDNQNLPF